MKVLVVDDDNVSSTLVSRILQKNGYKTLVVPSAERSIKHLEAGEPIMLIILDLVMPDMDGKKFMEQHSNRPGMQDIPVIICSGDKLQGSELRSVQMGAKGYLVKPIDAETLLKKVEQVVNNTKPPLLDKKQVMSRLQIREETYKEMLNILIQSGTSAVQEINELMKNKDFEKLLCVAVGLKGGAMSLGAERLSNVLKKMEDVVKGQKENEIQDMACAIQREVNIIKSIVQ